MTSTDLIAPGPPAWPGCALGAWAAAWSAGRCGPDDVTDTLGDFADRHVVDGDALPPDLAEHSRLGLLALVRRGRRLAVRLPTAGDPQGLPPGPATAAALDAGEILLIDDHAGNMTVGLVPTLVGDVCHWGVHRYEQPVEMTTAESLAQLEYDLREAIRETAEIIGGLGGSDLWVRPAALRATLATLTARHQVDLPPHDDARATRVIDSAARVEAIVTMAGAHVPTFGVTAGHVETGDAGLRRLATLARNARAAAVNRVIGEHLPTGP
ncbi:hypothetical protein V1Y59_08115 [Gordonia sp. PKS22-38]|uniref:Serine/threonine protein kinase n=1 Tax=Gordonia prachuapensis TaxID=3115651 RepID=A0ABU7MRU1_9ACTN|nr:hypothetical protein [Gordonia sp. PKS22-38]